jgi:hypothetical protein
MSMMKHLGAHMSFKKCLEDCMRILVCSAPSLRYENKVGQKFSTDSLFFISEYC